MSSRGKKRDVTDFFKPYPYPRAVPAKRPPSSWEDDPRDSDFEAEPTPAKTLATVARCKNSTQSPYISPVGVRVGEPVAVPIRSPKPTPAKNSTSPFIRRLLAGIDSKHDKSPDKPKSPFMFANELQRAQSSVVKTPSKQNPATSPQVIEIKDSDEDDLESLESLEDIFGRRRTEPAVSSSSPPEMDDKIMEAQRVSVLSMFTTGRSDPLVGRDRLRAFAAKERAHKFDIGKLLNDHLDDADVEASLSRTREQYQVLESERNSRQARLDQNLLKSIIINNDDDGQDNASRLLNAVERTETLVSETTFSFFGSHGLVDWQNEAPPKHPFPDVGDSREQPLFVNEDMRERTYLSGYMAEAADSNLLPDSVVKWTFERAAIEPHDHLRHSYIECVRRASSTWTRTNVSPLDVQNLFLLLGADQEVLSDGAAVEPQQRYVVDQRSRSTKFLVSVLQVLAKISPDLDFASLSKLTSILCRLAMDGSIMSESEVSTSVEEILSNLLDLPESQAKAHVAERILLDMNLCLKDPILQAQLLKHLLPTSLTAANTRVELARRFLLGDAWQTNQPTNSWTQLMSPIWKHLNSPRYDMAVRSRSQPTDYSILTAMTQLLDTAIADGNRPELWSPFTVEEKSFNREVDAVADRVKSIFSSIADTGASHMRRTEAKEALQALHYRLIFAVRTKPRLKKNVFGGRDGADYRAEEKGRGAMAKFLGRKSLDIADTTNARNIPEEAYGNLRAEAATIRSQDLADENMIRAQLRLS